VLLYETRYAPPPELVVIGVATSVAFDPPVAARARTAPGQSASERRAHARYEGSALQWLNRVRVKYGPALSVIDLSAGGAQVEGRRGLLPGSTIVIQITGGAHDTTMLSRVVRCEVADIASEVRYRGALEFKHPLALGPEFRPPSRKVVGHVPGWHRMVANFRDGRLLKGYGRNFVPARGHILIEAVPDGPPETRIVVRLAHLKALFFVHEFDGLKPDDAPAGSPQTHGRPIMVTFFDGEVMTGTTLNYSAEGQGFFMSPLNDANNHRVFVVGNAVQRVQFP
jgi:hypothetical protein